MRLGTIPRVRVGKPVLVPMKAINDLVLKGAWSVEKWRKGVGRRSINTCFRYTRIVKSPAREIKGLRTTQLVGFWNRDEC
jgi:hypothetical protein